MFFKLMAVPRGGSSGNILTAILAASSPAIG